MRPRSIILFERVYLTMIALALTHSVIVWDDSVAMLDADPVLSDLGAAYLLFVLAASMAINLLLWYFVVRRASNVARWILVIFLVINLISVALHVSAGAFPLDLPGVLDALAMVLYLAATALIFRRDASEWFERKGRMLDPDIFS